MIFNQSINYKLCKYAITANFLLSVENAQFGINSIGHASWLINLHFKLSQISQKLTLLEL